MYQINGILGISNHRVRHPYFYFIVGFFSCYQLIPLSIILCFLGKSRVEPRLLKYISGTLTYHSFPGHLTYNSFLASHPAEPHPTDQSYLGLQKSLHYNSASYFIDTLSSPYANTWHHRGGPITQKIYHFCLNHNPRRYLEPTRKTLISCIYQGVKYTGRNVTKKHGRPYLLSSSYEINLIC